MNEENPFIDQRDNIIKAHMLGGYSKENAATIADRSILAASAALQALEVSCSVNGSVPLSLSTITTAIQLVMHHLSDLMEVVKADPLKHLIGALEAALQSAIRAGDEEEATFFRDSIRKAKAGDAISMTEFIMEPGNGSTKH